MSANRDHRVGRLGLALVCILSAVVLLALRAAELSGMSSGFAARTVVGEWYFFSHHLLYQPIVRIFASALGPIGCDVVCAGQVHSVLWAMVAVGSAYVIVHYLTHSIRAAVAAAALVLFSNGFWIFATQLEPYVPLLALNTLIAAIVVTRPERPLGRLEIGVLTGVFSFSLFFHQANVFFLVPLAIYLTVAHGRPGFWAVFKIGVLSGLIALGVNVLAFWGTHPGADFRDFYLWLNYYGVISNDAHGSWDEIVTMDASRARDALRSLVSTFISVPSGFVQRPVRLLVAAALALIVFWNTVQVKRQRPHARARLLLLLWTATFVIFFWWWHPGIWKFYIVVVTPVAILGTLMSMDIAGSTSAAPARRRVVGVLGVSAIAAVAAGNLHNSIWPLATKGSDIVALSGKLVEATPPDCMIYTERKFGGYIGYYFKRSSRPFELMFLKYHYSQVKPEIADAISASIDLKEDSCAVIPLNWLSRQDYERKNRRRSMRLVEGAEQTESEMPEWDEFIRWILDVRPAPDAGGVTHDVFTLFQIGAGDTFVAIDRRKREQVESMETILERIQAATDRYPLGALAGNEEARTGEFRQRMFSYY
jgi:hypothetical protein